MTRRPRTHPYLHLIQFPVLWERIYNAFRLFQRDLLPYTVKAKFTKKLLNASNLQGFKTVIKAWANVNASIKSNRFSSSVQENLFFSFFHSHISNSFNLFQSIESLTSTFRSIAAKNSFSSSFTSFNPKPAEVAHSGFKSSKQDPCALCRLTLTIFNIGRTDARPLLWAIYVLIPLNVHQLSKMNWIDEDNAERAEQC